MADRDTAHLYKDVDAPSAPEPKIKPIPPPPGQANPAPPPAYTVQPAAPPLQENTYTTAPGAVHQFPKKADVHAYQPLAPQPQPVEPQPQPGFQPQPAYQPQPGYQPAYQPAYQPNAPFADVQQQSSCNVTVVTTQPTMQRLDPGPRPESYLILSIFTCICCCWLLGIFAIVYSLQVDSSWSAGDFEGARRSSRTALKLNIATVVVGIVCGVVFGVISGVSRVTSSSTQYN